MFWNAWEPVSRDTVRDEEAQWSAVLLTYINIPELVQLIVHDYEGLCPSRFHTGNFTVKVIDSIPNPATAFEQDVRAFQDVLTHIMHTDDYVKAEDIPRTTENAHMMERLCSLRKFIEHASGHRPDGDTTDGSDHHAEVQLESMLLPSTIQTGLECIIITLCRVVAT